MRNYLDGYFDSLSTGQHVLAQSFVWNDRRAIGPIAFSPGSNFDMGLLKVSPNNVVSYGQFEGLLSGTFNGIDSIAGQVNTSATIREALNSQADIKLGRIEAALQALDIEVTGWLDSYSNKPEASGTPIKRSFGTMGIRPIQEMDNTLNLLSTVVQANSNFKTDGNAVVANAPDRVTETFFSDQEGFQARVTYNFVAGNATRIHLEPINGIGSVTVQEIRVYDTNGQIVSVLASNEELTRTLEYSIPRTMISRIEADLIDLTYNLVQIPEDVTKIGQRRQVIPAHTEKQSYEESVTLYWREIEAFNLTSYQLDLLNQLYDNQGGVEGILYAFNHPEIAGYKEATVALNTALGGVFDRFSTDTAGLQEYIDNLFKPQYGGTEVVTKYRWVSIPENILLTPYSYNEIDLVTRYRYCVGLQNLSCINDFYTEVYRVLEEVNFDSGMPTSVSLTVDEYLPDGSYINFFIVDKEGNVTPILPENREFTTEVMRFNEYGQANLLFYPTGATYFYKDNGEPTSLALNGKTVLSPSANMGSLNTVGGADAYWARYQPDRMRANIIPHASRTASYISDTGALGEVFQGIPSSKSITLKSAPYIDHARVGESGYTPVQVVIDGYTTVDTTKYDNTFEDEFPVNAVYAEGKKLVHYKVRGKTIYFESELDRPVRVLYEFLSQRATLMIEMGIIHGRAAAPVLYQYSLSYI